MTYSFTAKKRDDVKAEMIRAEGLIPAVLYGAGEDSVSIVVEYNPFLKLYNEAGESSLIDLKIGDKDANKALIQDVQYDPVKGTVIHVDFRRINMNKEMTATVELNFIGEAPAVKELGGTLVKAHNAVEIKCLPKDLISEIEVDLSVLKDFNSSIRVKDLKVPAGIAITDDLEQVITKVAAPLTEEELKAMEEAVAPSIDQIEVEKKGKEEAGEGAEGSPSAGAQGKKDE